MSTTSTTSSTTQFPGSDAPNTVPAHSTAAKLLADFRSDTVTQPTDGMWAAMYSAPLGDDVFVDDPSVNQLEAEMAELMGHEAALWFPTGSMSNQAAMIVHGQECRPSVLAPEVILSKKAHIYVYEAGGLAQHSRIQPCPLIGSSHPDFLTADDIAPHIHTEREVHHTQTIGICVENAMNGNVWPFEDLKAIKALADSHGIWTHMDGARLWNASVAENRPMKEYGALLDSVSLCMSKGLGAPGGSVLTGRKEFIDIARYARKMLGGGMRQVGMFAAAARYAVKHNWGDSMKTTHEDASWFGDELVKMGFEARKTDTNQVWMSSGSTGIDMKAFCALAGDHGIKMYAFSSTLTRMVIHFQTPREKLTQVLAVFKELIPQSQASSQAAADAAGTKAGYGGGGAAKK